jgi:hypothetical protein
MEKDLKSLVAHSTALQITNGNATIDRRNSLTARERIAGSNLPQPVAKRF